MKVAGRAALVTALGMAGCRGSESILRPSGVGAAYIADLWWFLFAIAVLVFVSVAGMLLYGVFGHRGDRYDDVAHDQRRHAVQAAVGVTVVLLVAILFASMVAGRVTADRAGEPEMTVHITGHQWWWEIRYEDGAPSQRVTTANELHIPVGRRVRVLVRSQDVIHSFWIPRITGKIDVFPDRENESWLEATEPGVYRGICAEFCGMQHARMHFVVVAHEPAEFEGWLERERAPAPEPRDSLALRGREIFEQTTCAMCHRIRGTAAHGTFGPDLTHLAGRRTIGAGTLPNTRGRLMAWIVDPQRFKPGAFMPANTLDAESLEALTWYLEQLR